jgi:RNA polymerase sigma factor (sigma-70 family)
MSAADQEPGVDQGRVAQFNTTHWSVVLAAGQSSSPAAQAALEQLCRAYWFPLYCYVRRAGHTPEDAQDLTQEFFARLLEKNYFALASRERGRFRSFLLTSLKSFLTNEYHRSTRLKRGGTQAMISFDSADAENRYVVEPIDTATPETLYEQRWALTLLENTMARLRDEYAAHGRGPMFDLLKAYVWGERNASSYKEIAAQLDLTEEAVKKAVQRLRHLYRDMLRTEIAHTVTTAAEVEEELQHLVRLLRR